MSQRTDEPEDRDADQPSEEASEPERQALNALLNAVKQHATIDVAYPDKAGSGVVVEVISELTRLVTEGVYPAPFGTDRRLDIPWVLTQYRQLAGDQSQEGRVATLKALTLTDPNAISPASLAQAKWQAARRNALLSTPTYTYETLQLLRGDSSVAATRTAVSRMVAKRQLFTVPVSGRRVVIPAFLLTETGEPRAELRPLLEPLLEADFGPWQLWVWLTSPTPMLSGDIPVELAVHPARAHRALIAAQRMAEYISPAGPVPEHSADS